MAIIVPNRHVTEHILYGEVACNHCNELIIDDLFYKHMELLEQLRQEAGWAIIINSGHRCDFWNKHEGGKPDSMHLKFATDVAPQRLKDDTEESIQSKLKIIGILADNIGFTGIGTYSSFRHLDCRPTKARWIG
jgi:hypothetical protein